jgi:hypothetical protein
MPAVAAPAPLNWFSEVGRLLTGGGWPTHYLVVDTETNSLDVMSDACLPVQVGWLAAEHGAVKHHGALLLDWSRPGTGVDPAWLAETLEATRAGMAARGHPYHVTIDRMKSEGVDPVEGLGAFADLIAQALDGGFWVAGHNLIGFDLPLLARVFRQRLGRAPAIPPGRVLDTMLVERARMLKRCPPADGDGDHVAWLEGVRKVRTVKSNLGEHCVEVYKLAVDASKAHDAGADCRTNYLLIEAMRKLAEATIE